MVLGTDNEPIDYIHFGLLKTYYINMQRVDHLPNRVPLGWIIQPVRIPTYNCRVLIHEKGGGVDTAAISDQAETLISTEPMRWISWRRHRLAKDGRQDM
jgi:hypothetical protein